MKKVAIVMGSDSDLPVARAAKDILTKLGIMGELFIYSAHRTPDEAAEFAKTAEDKGYQVIIGIAGMAAHLSGVLASQTILPVIGVPCDSGSLRGLDALLATVQMPPGIPVATVGINNGKNAGLLAAEILAGQDQLIADKLRSFRQEQREAVLAKAKLLNGED